MKVFVVIHQPEGDVQAVVRGVYCDETQATEVMATDPTRSFINETDLVTGDGVRMRGVIKSVKAEMGYGFLRSLDTDEGTEFFFHRTALRNVRLEELRVGVHVTFEIGIG